METRFAFYLGGLSSALAVGQGHRDWPLANLPAIGNRLIRASGRPGRLFACRCLAENHLHRAANRPPHANYVELDDGRTAVVGSWAFCSDSVLTAGFLPLEPIIASASRNAA